MLATMIERGAGWGKVRVPWDRRLTDSLARDAWLAANNRSARSSALPLRDRARSRWFWLGLLPLAAVAAAFLVTHPHGTVRDGLWIAYFVAIWFAVWTQNRIRRSP
jgi:hypothetical protein